MLLSVVAGAADGGRSARSASGRRLPRGLPVACPGAGSRSGRGGPAARPAPHRQLGPRVPGLPGQGNATRLGYLAAVAAAAAVGPSLPIRTRRTGYPGPRRSAQPWLAEVTSQDEWVRLSSDGRRLRAGGHIGLACDDLVPDDGTGTGTDRQAVPRWRGTPLVRAEADGRAWEVLLEDADDYLDRYQLPVRTAMTAADVACWRRVIQDAWELLVRHHDWAAEPVAEGVSRHRPAGAAHRPGQRGLTGGLRCHRHVSPPSAVSMAEVLIHEFQHVKLGGLLDMVPLVKPGRRARLCARGARTRVPAAASCRDSTRSPGSSASGSAQRHVEAQPDEILRASVLYERWRLAIELVSGPCSAAAPHAAGARFVTLLRERGQRAIPPRFPPRRPRSPVTSPWTTGLPGSSGMRRSTPQRVADLADAYRRGEPLGGRPLPEAWIKDDTRDVGSVVPRSRLLSMRFEKPQLYRQLSAADLAGLGPADAPADPR